MSLQAWLASARYDAERDPGGADVIPLRAFDAEKCASNIKRLDVQAKKLQEQIANEERNYEETISLLKSELDAIQTELADRRLEVRAWAEHLGALGASRTDD